MKEVIAIGFILGWMNVHAQSTLPPCPSSPGARLHNCQGAYIFPGGPKYVGEWRDDKRNGQGTLTFVNGDKYIGEWRDGKSSGRGTYILLAGTTYVGEFNDNRYHGQGIMYSPSGAVIESGRWENGSLAQSFAIDVVRFPFKPQAPSTLIAQAQPDPPVSVSSTLAVDSGRAERDRLAAELEAARRRQRELEDRLGAEAKDRELLLAEARGRERLQVNRPSATRAERRVALVIGNSAYKSQPLINPVNDASDLASTLRSMGFETTLLRDVSLAQMRTATRQFADAAALSDVALIFFAGHGIEAKGRNYLIPLGAEIKHEYELDDQAYDAGRWLEMLEGLKTGGRQRVNIVILDACRNNEFARSWRSSNRGLARMDAPTGTFVSFSTAPGRVASDGTNGQRNSPFTKNLLKAIQAPDVPIELIFKEVRRLVLEETKSEQVPWENSSLVGDFVFRRSK